MKKRDLGQTIGILANFGVLAGIILLVLELNQATLISQAEMISSHNDRWVTIDLSWQDRDFAAAWAKAIEAPDELTVTEMIQLNGFMWSYFDHIDTTEELSELGIFNDSFAFDTVEQIINSNAYIFFGNKFSQAWLAENRQNLNPRMIELVDQASTRISADENLDSYRRIKTKISE